MFGQHPGQRSRSAYDDLTGYPSLAAAIMKDAAKHDCDWFAKDPIAVHFWCDVAGISYEALSQALERWRVVREEKAARENEPPPPAPILLSLYRAQRQESLD